MVARACIEVAIRTGCPSQVLGGGAFAVAGRAVRAEGLVTDPIHVFGCVRVKSFDDNAAAGGVGYGAVMFPAEFRTQVGKDDLQFRIGGRGAGGCGSVDKSFEKSAPPVLVDGGTAAVRVVVGDIVY